MKKNLLPLPFLAVFFAAMALAFGNAFKEKAWIAYGAWGGAAVLLLVWASLDQANFVRAFRSKGTKYGASSGLTILLVLAIIVGAGILTTKPRFNKSYDATRSGVNTLSDQSSKVVKTLKQRNVEPELIGIFQEEQQKTKFKDLLALYTSHGLTLKETWIDPQSEPTKAMAEKVSQANTVILRNGLQEARITTFNEEKFTNGLVNMTKDRAKKVYFTKGHGEGDINNTEAQGFSRIVEELKNNKYEVAELSLLEAAQIPADADLVVVAGPHYDLKSGEAKVLSAFATTGKPVLVMVDAMVQVPTLNQFLAEYGIRFKDNLLILRPDDPRTQLLGQNNAIVTEFDQFNPVTKDFASQSAVAILMPSTRALDKVLDNPKAMKVSLVAKTSDAIVGISDIKTERDLKNIGKDRIQTGPFGVVAVATGRVGGAELATKEPSATQNKADSTDNTNGMAKELRIVAIGSAQAASNFGLQRSENLDLFANSVNYLLQDEDFIAIRPKDPIKTSIDLATPGSQLALVFICFIYPFVFLGGGLLSWFRRRSA